MFFVLLFMMSFLSLSCREFSPVVKKVLGNFLSFTRDSYQAKSVFIFCHPKVLRSLKNKDAALQIIGPVVEQVIIKEQKPEMSEEELIAQVTQQLINQKELIFTLFEQLGQKKNGIVSKLIKRYALVVVLFVANFFISNKNELLSGLFSNKSEMNSVEQGLFKENDFLKIKCDIFQKVDTLNKSIAVLQEHVLNLSKEHSSKLDSEDLKNNLEELDNHFQAVVAEFAEDFNQKVQSDAVQMLIHNQLSSIKDDLVYMRTRIDKLEGEQDHNAGETWSRSSSVVEPYNFGNSSIDISTTPPTPAAIFPNHLSSKNQSGCYLNVFPSSPGHGPGSSPKSLSSSSNISSSKHLGTSNSLNIKTQKQGEDKLQKAKSSLDFKVLPRAGKGRSNSGIF